MENLNLTIVFGFSGSGKDATGQHLATKSKSSIIKFAAPGKRALEFMLKIPPGSLDDRYFRQQIAPHCQGRTYLQVLVDFYHHKGSVIGEDLFTQQTVELIRAAFAHGRDVIITDLRSWDECRAIQELIKDGGISLKLYWIERNAAKMLTSDQSQEACYTVLKRVPGCVYAEIDNNGSLQQLRLALDKR